MKKKGEPPLRFAPENSFLETGHALTRVQSVEFLGERERRVELPGPLIQSVQKIRSGAMLSFQCVCKMKMRRKVREIEKKG